MSKCMKFESIELKQREDEGCGAGGHDDVPQLTTCGGLQETFCKRHDTKDGSWFATVTVLFHPGGRQKHLPYFHYCFW